MRQLVHELFFESGTASSAVKIKLPFFASTNPYLLEAYKQTFL